MGGTSSKHTEFEVFEEKKKHEAMTLGQRRKRYGNHVPLDQIETWTDYFNTKIRTREGEMNPKKHFTVNIEINKRVSIINQDITELEIDAVVNSTSDIDQGLVNRAIKKKAGVFFADECIHTGLPQPGEVIVTCGYNLPAKNVITTAPPPEKYGDILRSCYINSLKAAADNGFKTVAFPSIATKKSNGFSHECAARIVLKTVREWMEANLFKLDRVIFCLFTTESLVQYNWLMQEYFPVDPDPVSTNTATSFSNVDSAARSLALSPLTGGASNSATTDSRPVSQTNEAIKRTILETRRRYERMSQGDKRREYKVPKYVQLSDITNWQDYDKSRIRSSRNSPYDVRANLNRKVALWSGDITHLEIDAIVNSSSGPTGGKVNTAIQDKAGNMYREECDCHGYPKPGDVVLRGGYRLPAKYVLHTCPPDFRKSDNVLKQCYTSCLDQASVDGLKNVAFPCIATHKTMSFSHKAAAELALECVRYWLENDRLAQNIELVIFCVFDATDLDVYRQQMMYFFPV